MPLPAVNCHTKSSFSQPNQPGLTSPETPPPPPTKDLSMKRPSLTVSVGRTTPRKSTWPQGCAQYEAKATSGAEDLVGLKDKAHPAVGLISTPLARQPVVVPLVTGFWPRFVSVLTLPAGVTMSVSGVSAEIDQALPYGPE